MEKIILMILIGLAGGVAVGLQSPLASLMSQRLGVFESIFIVHIGGALAALVPRVLVCVFQRDCVYSFKICHKHTFS